MVQKLPFKAVLFDLDGTLIHSAPDAIAAVNHVFSDNYNKAFTDEQVGTYLANGIDNILASLAKLGNLTLSEEELALLKAKYLAYYKQHPVKYTTVFPGVFECLEELHSQGVILAICSNKPSVTARIVLEKLGLAKYFSCIIAGDDTPSKKPNPIHVRLVLDEIAVLPEDAVMVGDAGPDVQAAQALGMPAVLFSNTGSFSEALNPDACFQSFSCLTRTLCSLRS